MTAKSNAEKQRDYYRRMIARGFKATTVFVPADKVKELRAIAKVMRERGANDD